MSPSMANWSVADAAVKKIMKADKMVEDKDAEKWINDSVIGGITKVKLDS